tara:strand:- start:66 stop:440 length:375 start_codon:yes stop_codon:yes gene_type:complete
MENKHAINYNSNVTNYQALNCNGLELGIAERLVTHAKDGATHLVLSTHHKDLFGNLKYAVPFDLCEVDHENKTVWLNIEKNELEFLYKFSDIYDNLSPSWHEIDEYFNACKLQPSNYGSNMNHY